MKLTMLGTGNAMVTECYNTCFVLSEGQRHFLVDGGGGNTILRQLARADIDWKDIKDIFITHKHIDHLMGIIWLLRFICQNMNGNKYPGEVNLYAHDELIGLIDQMAHMLLPEKQTRFIGQRVHLIPVSDGETHNILGCKIVFFDIRSTKAKQYGFTMYYDDVEKLTCCGDEPYNPYNRQYAENSTWLLHEAFCPFQPVGNLSSIRKTPFYSQRCLSVGREIAGEELDSLPYGRPEHLETKGAVQQRGGGLFQRRVICAGRFASDTAVVMTDKRFLQREENGAREVKKTLRRFVLQKQMQTLFHW